MKVVYRGTLFEEMLYKGTCMACMSRVEATHNELKHTDCQRDGDTHSADCPVCATAGRSRTIYFQRVVT